mmetsp:Transcript_10979/g.10990  ORF Transcript_10979/g.10990 Transcript_10979/m.10990 type:complete len:366 (-) Transcript_10979:277-1374(-)
MADSSEILNGPCRNGRWTPEEENYALKLMQKYKSMSISERKNKSMRTILAEKLNCSPMRISKKFGGNIRSSSHNDEQTKVFTEADAIELSELQTLFLATDEVVRCRRVKRRRRAKNASRISISNYVPTKNNPRKMECDDVPLTPDEQEILQTLSDEITDNDLKDDDVAMYNELLTVFSDDPLHTDNTKHTAEVTSCHSPQTSYMYDNTYPMTSSQPSNDMCLLRTDFDRPALVQMSYNRNEIFTQPSYNIQPPNFFTPHKSYNSYCQPKPVTSPSPSPFQQFNHICFLPSEIDGRAMTMNNVTHVNNEGDQSWTHFHHKYYYPNYEYYNNHCRCVSNDASYQEPSPPAKIGLSGMSENKPTLSDI